MGTKKGIGSWFELEVAVGLGVVVASHHFVIDQLQLFPFCIHLNLALILSRYDRRREHTHPPSHFHLPLCLHPCPLFYRVKRFVFLERTLQRRELSLYLGRLRAMLGRSILHDSGFGMRLFDSFGLGLFGKAIVQVQAVG